MTVRGEFSPIGFDPNDPATWPQRTGATLAVDDQTELLATDDAASPIRTDEPWYTDGDEWVVTAAGVFGELQLVPGGRLIARV